jgi:hypothetical protein
MGQREINWLGLALRSLESGSTRGSGVNPAASMWCAPARLLHHLGGCFPFFSLRRLCTRARSPLSSAYC